MTELQIKVKYSKGQVNIKEFSILSDMLIDDLRIIIEEEFKIPPYKQNLIYKGKMLQNEKKIEDYKISNNDIILLVEKVGETGEKVGLTNVKGQTGVGAPGQINYDLLKQPMGFQGDLGQVIEAMKIPEIAGQVDSMFDDPNIINSMLENPQVKALCDLNPNIKNLLTNKEFMKSMLQPENLERMKKIQDGTANFGDMLHMANLNGGDNNNMNNNWGNNMNMNMNNNWSNNNMNNPFGMFGMPMFNPLLMNPMMRGMPNLFGQGLGNNLNNNANNNLNVMTQEQLKEKYKEQIGKIKDMGFDNEEDIANALKKTNGNIDAAIERLISGLK